jgi:hypothetical protein
MVTIEPVEAVGQDAHQPIFAIKVEIADTDRAGQNVAMAEHHPLGWPVEPR